MPIALFALTLSAFAIGTTEFVIVGLVPTIATDLGVTLPSAGLLVSLYAVGVAVGHARDACLCRVAAVETVTADAAVEPVVAGLTE